MDVSTIENVLVKYPTYFKDFKKAGINLPEEWLEICPGAHFTLGGIKINEFCETTLTGLYASGEVAGNLHGANRIAGSALPECSVFGQIAGENAALHSKFRGMPEPKSPEMEEETDRILEFHQSGKRGLVKPTTVIRELRRLMYDKVGVLRTGSELSEAIEEISRLKAKAHNLEINPNTHYNNEPPRRKRTGYLVLVQGLVIF